jgi:hypothetical protein
MAIDECVDTRCVSVLVPRPFSIIMHNW